MKHEVSVCVVALTDAGGRETNEDSHLALFGDRAPCQTLGLMAVADGMGGTGNGHVASSIAMETLADTFAAACEVSQGKPVASTRDLLRFAVQKANAAVFQAAQRTPEHRGMGTTCVAAAITDEEIHIAHVGDSRAYLLRDGKLRRLVDDQWVKPSRKPEGKKGEAQSKRGGITYVNMAVGWQPLISPEVISEPVQEDDRVLICTDGLTDELPEEEIERIINEAEDVPQACNRLMKAACAHEDCDNITLVLAKISAGWDQKSLT